MNGHVKKANLIYQNREPWKLGHPSLYLHQPLLKIVENTCARLPESAIFLMLVSKVGKYATSMIHLIIWACGLWYVHAMSNKKKILSLCYKYSVFWCMPEKKNRQKTKNNQTNKKSNETKQNKKSACNSNAAIIIRLGPEL